MPPHSTDSTNELHEQEVLDCILPLIQNVIEDGEGRAVSNSVMFDTSAEEIGEALGILIEEASEDMEKPLLLIEAPITNKPLFEKLCKYVSIDENIEYDENAKIYLLKNHDFNISIIPLTLSEDRTLLFIQSLQRRPEFMFTLWDHIVGGFERPIDMSNLQDVSVKLKI